MAHDNLHTDGTQRLVSGIQKAARAVGATMGSLGSNAIIQAIEQPGFLTTNDGFTILQAITFADPLEQMGKQILQEAVSRANKQSGDGSSTTTVLTAALIKEGLKSGFTAIEIKRSLEEELPKVEDAIRE